jgi:ribosomal protein S18 acetylase RimI-like enzyme
LTLTVHRAAAGTADTAELAAVAAQTFPLACPPTMAPENVAAFVDATLSAARFAEYLEDSQRAVLTARYDGRIIGYAMAVHEATKDTAELSKIYVLSEHHGTGAAQALMDGVLTTAGHWAVGSVWLGVNQKNERAQRFYAKNGFVVRGTRTFQVGARLEDDFVMVRELR